MVSSFEEVPARDRVIVALDCGIEEAFDLADQLQGKATWMKVGMTLFYANGPAIVYALKERGFKVFLDLKFHDIPHQVEGAAYAAAGSGADMLTMHTVGGVDMMAAAQKGAERAAAEYGHDVPATLGITVLTSMNDAALAETGVSRAMAARGVRMDDSAGKDAKALSDANAECVAGFRQRHPGEGDGDCRVVAVGAASGNGSTTSVWNGSGVYDAKIWKDNWYKYVAPNTYNYAGSQSYHTGDGFSDDPSNSVDKIMERHVDSTRSIVVIVLDKYQPAPPNYTLSVATKASGTTTKAGDTQNVADTVTTSRNGSSISENVTGTSTLRWAGVDGTTHNTWNGDTEVTAEGYYYASEDETILQPVARKDGETVDQITSTLR